MGVAALEDILKKTKDSWLKISYYRGEMETFHHINWAHTEVFLNDLRHNLGPLADKLEFLVEDGIKSIAEIGYDGFSSNGLFPNKCMWGLEVKDTGYIGKVDDFKTMPRPIQDVNNKFSNVLRQYEHKGFFSTEIRYTENKMSYFTDPCMRAGSPPSNTMLMMIDNWEDIIPAVCNGKIVEPIFNGKYGVEIILKSTYCNDNYLPVSFPAKYDRNVKLKGSFRMNLKDYICPWSQSGFGMTEFGSVVVIGDDINTIAQQALDICAEINAYDMSYEANAINIALEQIKGIEEALKIKF